MDKKSKNKVPAIILSIVLLPVILIVSAYFIFMLPGNQRRILDFAEDQIEQILVGDCSIGSISTNFFSQVEIKDISLKDPTGHGDSIVIGSVRARIFLLSLFRKKIDVQSVLIDKIDALLTVNPDGRLMIPALPDSAFIVSVARSPDSSTPPPTEWSLHIGFARAINVNVTYSDSNLAFVGKIRNSIAEAKIYNYDSMDLRLSVPDGSYESPWWTGTIDTIESSALLTLNGMVFNEILFVGESTHVDGIGRIPFSYTGYWDLSVKVHSSVAPVKAIYGNIPFLTNRGMVIADASWKGTIAHPVLNCHITGSALKTEAISVPSLNVRAHYDGDSLVTAYGAFVTDVGRATCSAMVFMPQLFVHPSLNEYRMSGKVSGIDLSRTGVADSLKKYIPWTTGDGTFYVRGTGVERFPDTTKAHVDLHNPDSTISSASIDMSYVHNSWRFGGTWGNDYFSGSGLLKKNTIIDGSIKAHFNDVTVVSALFLGEHVEGNVTISSEVGGTINSPELSAVLFSNALLWRSIKVDSLLVHADIDKNKIDFKPSFVSINADINSVASNWGIHDFNGSATLEAMFWGNALKPDISVIGSVQNLRYASWLVDSTNAIFTITDLDSIDLKQLHMYKNGAQLSAAGNASILSKMVKIDIKPSILNGKMWSKRGSLHVAGEIGNDSLRVSVAGDAINLASINEWIPMDDSIAGICAIRAELKGTRYNPHGFLDINIESPKFNEMSIQDMRGHIQLADSVVDGEVAFKISDLSKSVTLAIHTPVLFDSVWIIDMSGPVTPVISLAGSNVSAMELIKYFGGKWNSDGLINVDARIEGHKGEWMLGGNVGFASGLTYNSNENIQLRNCNVTGLLSGSLKDPLVKYVVTTSPATFPGGTIDSLILIGTVGIDTLRFDTVRVTLPHNGLLELSGVIPLNRPDSLFFQPGFEVEFDVVKFPMRLIADLFPENMISEGFAHGKGSIKINRGRPILEGTIFIDSAKIALEDINPVIGPIHAIIQMRNDSLILESLKGNWGKGTIAANGAIIWSTNKLSDLKIDVSGQNIEFEMTDVISVNVPEMKSTIKKQGDKIVISGNVDFEATRFIRDMRINDLILDANADMYTGIRKDSLLDNIDLKLKLNFIENPIIDMNLGYFELGGDIIITGSAEAPSYIGEIYVIQGYVLYFDRQFEITEGSFVNYDPQLFNPVLNLKAQTEVFASSAEDNIDNFTIYLDVSGTLDNPVVKLSDKSGELKEADIISILTLGQRLGSVGEDLGERLRAFAGQSVLGFGTRKLEQALKMDRIDIQGDIFKIGSKTSPTLTLSKRILPRLTVSYETAIGDFTQRKFTALFRLTKHFFVKGNADSDDYGVDMILKYSK